ncbi:rod shape-determining protein MreD [Lactococcus termiticola]|nr:rod shape-determining protein MreD [Lactococcus termiticola]
MSRFSLQFIEPIMLFLLLLIDGQLTQVLGHLMSGPYLPVSHLVLIFLIYAVTCHRQSYLVFLGIFLGLVYDAYFIGVYGIASLLFPIIALFLYNIQTVVFTNRWTRLFTVIIVVAAFEVLSAVLAGIAGIGTHDVLGLIAYQLAPSLLINIVFALLLQAALERLYKLGVGNMSYKTK